MRACQQQNNPGAAQSLIDPGVKIAARQIFMIGPSIIFTFAAKLRQMYLQFLRGPLVFV